MKVDAHYALLSFILFFSFYTFFQNLWFVLGHLTHTPFFYSGATCRGGAPHALKTPALDSCLIELVNLFPVES